MKTIHKKTNFYDDLKQVYIETGRDCIQTVFLFNDTQIVESSFLEDRK